jgi:chromosome segregation protein
VKLTRLRIAGFKSFVDPVEIPIEPGLTGVVGPNGCGKSNLVEALRWVMGESSGKSLRGSGMEDVIFSGSGSPVRPGRPGRNMAEVGLAVDNAARTAPAAFNDADSLDVSRKIVRDEGSTYRINGREVRLRDVQLLFADAATGPRSPALVRQGQIAELIAARPQARRRILEDAAGIAGLHARRHEAELRLKAADDNLIRVEDVLREIEAQLDGLRRQGRQAARYRALSAEIRRLDALLHALAFAEARAAATEAGRMAAADGQAVAERAAEQAKAATAQGLAAHALPRLRDAEASAAAVLQRLLHARGALEAEERRAAERLSELERQGAEAERDLARATAERADAAATVARLEAESAELARRSGGAGAARVAAEDAARGAEADLSAVEAEVNRLLTDDADARARRAALERTGREEGERARRLSAERAAASRDLGQSPAAAADLEALRSAAEAAARSAAEGEEEAGRTRAAAAEAREAEARSRPPLAEAERAAQRLETEARTLAKLFAPAAGDRWPRALDAVAVAKASRRRSARRSGTISTPPRTPPPRRTGPERTAARTDPALPDGVPPLADFVEAPPALRRRLGQIGVAEEGAALRGRLKPGQRLVSRSGDLWRWDGFVQAAEAPSAAARRLAERNRLGDLAREAVSARTTADRLKAEAEAAGAGARAAASAEARALGARRSRERRSTRPGSA